MGQQKHQRREKRGGFCSVLCFCAFAFVLLLCAFALCFAFLLCFASVICVFLGGRGEEGLGVRVFFAPSTLPSPVAWCCACALCFCALL